nr:arginine deiminase family protein [Sediminibacillus albus]
MTKSQANTTEIVCKNEYSKLEKLFVCSPQFMEIREIINETQRHYIGENINVNKAVDQHEAFIKVLEEQGADVIKLQPHKKLNEQVFTRDIGFCINDQLFLSEMNNHIRGDELTVLREQLASSGIPYIQPFKHSIEGGDVLVDQNIVWVGISKRTSRKAANALNKQLPDYQVKPLPIHKDILHLDCALNILSPKWAIAYPGAFQAEDYQQLKNQYHIIEVSPEEQFTMGTNVLSIGGGKVISLPQNSGVNEKMRKAGFTVIEVEFSEIIKSGGSFRCCSLPILRTNN